MVFSWKVFLGSDLPPVLGQQNEGIFSYNETGHPVIRRFVRRPFRSVACRELLEPTWKIIGNPRFVYSNNALLHELRNDALYLCLRKGLPKP